MTTGRWVDQVPVPVPGEPGREWRIHRMPYAPEGSTVRFGVHASTLTGGATPHPPHQHAEEEILVVLEGRAALTVGADGGPRQVQVSAGAMAYYPAGYPHTLTADPHAPPTYLMFKWRAPAEMSDALVRLDATVLDARAALDELEHGTTQAAFRRRVLLDGATGYLGRLRSHVSVLAPGGGYAPHRDAHDVALVILDGEVDADGDRAGPDSVLCFAAGHPHGLANPGTVPARYLVIEFHGTGGTTGHPVASPRA